MKPLEVLCLTTIFFLVLTPSLYAQFNVDGQIIQRAEYRQGYGKLIEEDEKAAAFISQRARVNVQYELEKFKFYVSVQDVRTWGNTSQIKLTDPFLSLHEAWAETFLSNNLSIKLGRQELNYDNARFLGNLDWALQGRAHDFALLKYEKGAMKFHAGGGYNQDRESLTGNFFSTPNQYKVAHFIRYENAAGQLNFSVLFWNNGLQYSEKDNAGEIIKTDVYHRQTFGLPSLKYQLGNTGFSGFYYHQFGKDAQGRDVKAYDASAQVSHLFTIDTAQGSNFRVTLGIELLTGTDLADISSENNSFSPLYGTNHAHNGYMDMFYVGGRHENSFGLRDIFFRMRYDLSPTFFLSLNTHSFNSFIPFSESEDFNLGYEADLALGYILNRSVSLQAGYSQYFESNNLASLQNVENPLTTQNWGYLMMIYRPTMKNKFIGLQF